MQRHIQLKAVNRSHGMIPQTLTGLTNHGVTVVEAAVAKEQEAVIMGEMVPVVKQHCVGNGVPESPLND